MSAEQQEKFLEPGVVTAQPVGDNAEYLKEVRDRSKAVTLGAAKAYVSTLPVDQASSVSGCYKVYNPSCEACPFVGYSCPTPCCGCLWTPIIIPYAPCVWIVGLFLCTCKAGPGSYSCTDLKGNKSSLVKMDAERGTLGYFGENEYVSTSGDGLAVGCYCTK
mmetsp:Transcript_52974/g.147037  ORF Transcript_52974/g.147037 Transcript_52974/m.147037 type:complete len:162 (-) Transcript_52974:58-543(-)